jgi:hypothetical protein
LQEGRRGFVTAEQKALNERTGRSRQKIGCAPSDTYKNRYKTIVTSQLEEFHGMN